MLAFSPPHCYNAYQRVQSTNYSVERVFKQQGMIPNRSLSRTYRSLARHRRTAAYPGLFRRGRIGETVVSPVPRLFAQMVALFVVLSVATVITMIATGFLTYSQIAATLKPRLDALDTHDTFHSSRIYDRNGTLLYEFFGSGKRINVSLDDISPLVIQATIAIEDKTFFSNPGVDYEGIMRALYQNINADEEVSGASTISQQVIKNVILSDEERSYEKRYERKFKEIILALELNQYYNKEQILELYLNEVYYGNLAYGIEAASQVYFGIHASDLTLAQASLLSGLPQLPSKYDPITHLQHDEAGGFLPGVVLDEGWLSSDYQLPDDISPPKWRHVAVLRQMVDEGYITEREARRAAAQKLRFTPQEVPINAPHFVFYARKLLEEKYGQKLVSEGGLNIYTTLDLNIQRMVQQKAAEHITSLEYRNIHNAAVVVMQPYTGQILAMVGSIDYNAVKPTTTYGEEGNVLDGQVNVAIRERQPGSALKPFTYLAAMEQGMNPATVIMDVPTAFDAGDGTKYRPHNYTRSWYGPVRIRGALANSLNMPAVKALDFSGIQYTLDLLNRVGIREGLKRGIQNYGLSLTLGGGEVTPLELTTAYNTLASGGRYIPPTPFLLITDNKGNILESFSYGKGEQALAPDLTSIVVDMLSDDMARAPIWGTGSKLKLSRPAAVKTGTSEDWRDAWTVGFTPYVTVGVWSGNNNNERTRWVESLEGGGIIWRNVMEEFFTWVDSKPHYYSLFAKPFNNKLPEAFTLHESVEQRPVCGVGGGFAGRGYEYFTQDMLERVEEKKRSTDVICDYYSDRKHQVNDGYIIVYQQPQAPAPIPATPQPAAPVPQATTIPQIQVPIPGVQRPTPEPFTPAQPAEQPAPLVRPEQPLPVPEQPAPAPEQPAPAPEQPAPAPEQPAPVPEQPAPAPEQPAPVPEQPAPVPEQPAPAPEQPAPAPEQPAPPPEQPAPPPEQPAPPPEPLTSNDW